MPPTVVLHASWDADAVVLWGWDGRRSPGLNDLDRLVRDQLRAWAVAGARSSRATVSLPGGDVALPALRLGPDLAAEVLSSAWPMRRWSPSLRWWHAAAGLAAELVASGRVLPALDTVGLQWQARWSVVDDAEADTAIEALAGAMPPVVACAVAPARRVARSLTHDAVHALAAGHAAYTVRALGWRPELGASRTAVATMVRRVADALGRGGLVASANARQEAACVEVARVLADGRAVVEGAVPVDVQLRLVAPDGPDEPWPLRFEVVARHDPSLMAPAASVWAGDPGALTVVGDGGLGAARRALAGAAGRLAGRVPALAFLADDPEPAEAALDLDRAASVLGAVDDCARAGVAVLVPAGLVRRRARVAGRATPVEPGGVSAGLGNALVEVDWRVVLGDDPLGEHELAELAAAKAGLVQVRGEWVRVDADEVRAALANLARNRQQRTLMTPTDLLGALAEAHATGDDLAADGWAAELLAGLPDDRLAEACEPDGFAGSLRHYQRRALGWVQFLGRIGLGGCLADDMGLGKTPTTLAHLAGRASTRPSLVVCPLSVVRNWESEALRFWPLARVLVVHGTDRLRGEGLVAEVGAHDLVVTTYATATRDIEALAAVEWDVVVLDEAQMVKNHHTGAARAVRRLRAAQKVALTGTPVENRLAELWSILDAVNPGMLGGATWFRDRFAAPIERHADTAALEALRRLTGPFVLRRTKADRSLVPELPDKVEQVAWATLTREQASLYKAVVDRFLGEVDRAEGMSRRGLVLATLTHLKQVCNHPAHYLGDGSRLGGRSGKLARFDELVDELLDAGERALVFTQYREMGELLVRHLAERRGLEAPFLHGGVPKARRDRMVERFQHGDGPPLQLVSLKAGGTGLNLTAASRVIHYDRWWNPAVENQATDRAWRIGQVSTVFVHKLVCQGTLEERIDALITAKQELADTVVGSGEGWLTELSTDELRALLRLEATVAEGRQ